MTQYIGWVPTILGNLFFENCKCSSSFRIKNTLFKKKYNVTNVNQLGDDYQRRIVFSTRVDLRDSAIHKKTHGIFDIIMVCFGNENDSELNGHLYIYHENFPSIKKNTEKLKQLEKHLAEIRSIYKKGNDVTEQYTKIENLASNTDYLCKIAFSVNNLGFVNINCENKRYFKEDEESVLCRQAFYFIKDSIHTHKHHDPENDSLTTIHDSTSSCLGISMINDLKKALISNKRTMFEKSNLKTTLHNFRYSGIQAYAKSLIEACHIEKYISPDQYKSELKFFNNFLCSINSRIKEDNSLKKSRHASKTSFITTILLVLAFFSPVILLHKDTILKDYDLASTSSLNISFFKLLSLLLSNVEGIIVLWGIVISVFLLYKYKEPFTSGFWAKFKSLMGGFRGVKIKSMKRVVWITIAISIVLCSIGISIIFLQVIY